jgi:hypothetical protein
MDRGTRNNTRLRPFLMLTSSSSTSLPSSHFFRSFPSTTLCATRFDRRWLEVADLNSGLSRSSIIAARLPACRRTSKAFKHLTQFALPKAAKATKTQEHRTIGPRPLALERVEPRPAYDGQSSAIPRAAGRRSKKHLISPLRVY